MKKLMKIAGVLLLLKIALGAGFILYIDHLLKIGFEKFESEELGINIKIDKLYISLFTGTVNIKSFSLSNPPGFSDKPLLIVDQIHIKLDLMSLFGKTAKVKKIKIDSPEVHIERNKLGVNNVAVLKSHLISRYTPKSVEVNGNQLISYINGDAIKHKDIFVRKINISGLLIKKDGKTLKIVPQVPSMNYKENMEGEMSIPAKTKQIINLILDITHPSIT